MVKGRSERGVAPRWRLWPPCGVSWVLAACGGSAGTSSTPMSEVSAPTILAQPSNQSVPMGLTATFAVSAGGASLQYQWLKDGAAIAAANSSTYTTSPTAFADTGARYSVVVSNRGGSVTSGNAALTVTARAPAAGDLRFQQVDAPAVINGWGNAGTGLATAVPGRSAFYYSPSVGTPFYMGSSGNCDVPPRTDGTGCDWFYSEWPASSSGAPLSGYGADSYENFSADLQPGSTVWFTGGIGPNSPEAVINSLDLEPASDLFAVSWIQPAPANGAGVKAQAAQSTGFVRVENSVASSQLQTAATDEGAAGRVITAISADGGQVTYLAYAWQADPLTLYDTKVVTASTAAAPAAAGALAAQGYIITAIGQADASGDLFLVGTRVQGDSLARPFAAVQTGLATLQQQGYAIVGVITDLSKADSYTWLGER